MLKKIVFVLLFLPALVFAEQFIEGKDYLSVSNPNTPTIKLSRPMVMEFFSYGCPWCYKLEKPLQAWSDAAKNSVEIEKIPVVFKPTWNLYAKAYYTAKTLALTNKLSPALFKAIQEDKRLLESQQAMINFFVANGVDREIVKSAFGSSPTIDTQVKNGMTLMAQFQINAVPAFVINHHYKTDLQMAGSPERLFEIIHYLTTK